MANAAINFQESYDLSVPPRKWRRGHGAFRTTPWSEGKRNVGALQTASCNRDTGAVKRAGMCVEGHFLTVDHQFGISNRIPTRVWAKSLTDIPDLLGLRRQRWRTEDCEGPEVPVEGIKKSIREPSASG